MNRDLILFLANLNNNEAEELFLYLDEEPDVVGKMIEMLLDTHPAVHGRPVPSLVEQLDKAEHQHDLFK